MPDLAVSTSSLFAITLSLLSAGEIQQPREPSQSGSGPRIPHSLEVPAFVPPAPEATKPLPEMRVDAAVTVPTKDSTTLTIIRGEASTLPDIPPPGEPARDRRISSYTPEELAAREQYHRRHTLQLGATVYDHRVSVVHWRHPDTGEDYEAVCGFDISLLESVGHFIHDGERYEIMLTHTPLDTSRGRRTLPKPTVPEIADGAISFRKGNPNDPIGTAPITMIKELIAAEKPRLTAYQAARRELQAAQAAWEKANPPVPRDETVWLRPHRGSRYLADPRPEDAAR